MYFQASEYQRTNTKEYGCHNPEIHRRIKIFPEPLMFKHSTSVSIYNIEKRIDFQYLLYNFRHGFNLPQDRGCPHTNLQCNIDKLCQIPEEYDNRTGRITDCQYEHKQTEAVIYNLNQIDARAVSHRKIHDQHETYKEAVRKCCANDLNDRNDTDLKYYLFHQIGIFQ